MENINLDENREQGRLVGVLAYFWVPGWILALILNGQKRSELGGFHLRQSLGIMLFLLTIIWFVRYSQIIFLLQLAASIYGVLGALKYEKNPLPGLGPIFQQLFKAL
jgi:hypothetical protein